MRWPPKKVILAIVIIAIILIIWSGRSATSGAEHLSDRMWIDRVASSPRELVDLRYFHDDGVALLGKASVYRFNADLAEWSLDGEHLTLHLLQDDRSVTARVRTWKCGDGEAPDGFDYCMDLDGRRYFANDREDARIRALLPAP
jgi:hypothetical protein